MAERDEAGKTCGFRRPGSGSSMQVRASQPQVLGSIIKLLTKAMLDDEFAQNL
jgi:hypothetical protein